jgi:hypothetical protein
MVAGIPHELAQVGPGFCIVREPLDICSSDAKELRADLIIEVDGEPRSVAVILCSEQPSHPKHLRFRKVSMG